MSAAEIGRKRKRDDVGDELNLAHPWLVDALAHMLANFEMHANDVRSLRLSCRRARALVDEHFASMVVSRTVDSEPVCLPAKLRHLTFDDRFSGDLRSVAFPKGLLSLDVWGYDVTERIDPRLLPESLTSLCFGRTVFEPFDFRHLRHLTSLRFNHLPQTPSALNLLPPNLTSLRIRHGYRFDYVGTTDRVAWPPSLTSLRLGYGFARVVDVADLPASLTDLAPGTDFDKPIRRGSLPPKLSRLDLSGSFNQPLTGALPAGLASLSLGAKFDRPVDGRDFPASLTSLSCEQRLKGSLGSLLSSPNVLSLEFSMGVAREVKLERFPPKLVTLDLGQRKNANVAVTRLPRSLRRLRFNPTDAQWAEAWRLPSGLTSLSLDGSFNRRFAKGDLPASLVHLELGAEYGQPIDRGVLPRNIGHVHFGWKYVSQYEKPLSTVPILRVADLPPSVRTVSVDHSSFAVEDLARDTPLLQHHMLYALQNARIRAPIRPTSHTWNSGRRYVRGACGNGVVVDCHEQRPN